MLQKDPSKLPNVNILHNYSMIIRTKKLILEQLH